MNNERNEQWTINDTLWTSPYDIFTFYSFFFDIFTVIFTFGKIRIDHENNINWSHK